MPSAAAHGLENLNWADMVLGVLVPAAMIYALWQLVRFIHLLPLIHSGNIQPRSFPDLDLSWLDFLLYAAAMVLVYTQAMGWTPVASLMLIFMICNLRGQDLGRIWNIQFNNAAAREYLGTACRTYFTILIPLGLLTWLCYQILKILGFNDMVQSPVDELLNARSFGEILFFLCFACIIAPLWEEITFRGFLYPFIKNKWGTLPAIIISSLLFGLMHFQAQNDLAALVPLAALGTALAVLYQYKGSLAYCFALHAVFNFATCVTLLLMKYGTRS